MNIFLSQKKSHTFSFFDCHYPDSRNSNMITLMKYSYPKYVWVYDISRIYANMLQCISNSKMEAGLPFDLSNFLCPPYYLEAVKVRSYKTDYSIPSFNAGDTSPKGGTFTEFHMDKLNGDDS